MKDRIIPCKFYESEGNCTKGRDGTFKKYCQHCKKYTPVSSYKLDTKNKKKYLLDKIKREERY